MSNYNDYNDFLNDISQDEEWKEIEQYTNIISEIIIARNEKNMSQQELADKIGMKQSAIARIENCKIKPKIDTLIKIFNALDLDIVVEKKINFEKTTIRQIDMQNVLSSRLFDLGKYTRRKAVRYINAGSERYGMHM